MEKNDACKVSEGFRAGLQKAHAEAMTLAIDNVKMAKAIRESLLGSWPESETKKAANPAPRCLGDEAIGATMDIIEKLKEAAESLKVILANV